MNLSDLEGSKSSLANIGTCASGILYLSAPVTFTLLTRYPRLRRFCGPVGLALMVVGSILSSFATDVWHLIATQGVICALGSGLLYSPTTLYLDEWFVQRKGLAYGVMLASKSLAGAALPFLMGLCWIDSAFAQPCEHGQWLRTYLASYASTIGLKSQIGTLMIALLNATSVPGSLLIGMLNDRCHVTNVILISTIGSTLAVLIFWGMADQVALLAVFAILFAGGFSTTWSGVLIQMKQEMPALETGLVFGLLAGGRGIGNVISGPLSTILIDSGLVEASKSRPMGYETQYGWLIVFTGITALLGGWGWTWRVCQTLLQ
ncbi:hypothetical protein OEA41_010340 [Lepraria neglecta]|uniref:MFS general substrate transporter n=1 Tax=Lepraria neglecta TaxID=209136 RepID=A0AAE0DF74_9LECA|nr:hypothetical protein OEA41_010340 [Lepraria neglecta]